MDDLIYAGIDTAEAGIGAVAKRFARHSVVKWLILFRNNLIFLVLAAFFWTGTTFYMSLENQEPVKLLPLPQSKDTAILCLVVWAMAMFPWATTRVFETLWYYAIVPVVNRIVRIRKPAFDLLDIQEEQEAKESMALLDRISMTW